MEVQGHIQVSRFQAEDPGTWTRLQGSALQTAGESLCDEAPGATPGESLWAAAWSPGCDQGGKGRLQMDEGAWFCLDLCHLGQDILTIDATVQQSNYISPPSLPEFLTGSNEQVILRMLCRQGLLQ